MTHVSRSVAVACGVLGILILLCACGLPMIICGGVWIADFHNFRLHGTVFHEFKHINSAHGIWSGVLFIVGGGLGLFLFKYPGKQWLVIFLVACSIVSLVGWVEVGLLSKFLRSLLGQSFDQACTKGNSIFCKFMAPLRGIAAFAGIGALLAIGGIIAALVGIFSRQSFETPDQQQSQPQVVVMQFAQGQPAPGQYPATQQFLPGQYPATQQYPPGQYPATQQFLPGQYPAAQQFLPGQYPAAQYPTDQKELASPAYAQ